MRHATKSRARMLPAQCRSNLLWLAKKTDSVKKFVFLLAPLVFLTCPGAAQAQYAVGSLPGDIVVDNTGQANYSIPIAVPPGTGGMVPELSFNYGSHAGDGQMGVGWSLGGGSAISRGGRTMAQDGFTTGVSFTNADTFYLDGQRLILVDGVHGETGAEYRTEIASFSRITVASSNVHGPTLFVVQTKAGLTKTYGPGHSAFYVGEQGDGVIASWAVSRIEDTVGNYMTFQYVVGEAPYKEQMLTGIFYTVNGHLPYNRITFGYQLRSEPQFSYVAGTRFASRHLLRKVTVFVEEEIEWEYDVTYANSATTNRPLLRQIQRSVGTEALPPTTFEWSEPSVGLSRWTFGQSPSNIQPVDLGGWSGFHRFTIADLGARGISDLIQYRYNSSSNRELVTYRLQSDGSLPTQPPAVPVNDGRYGNFIVTMSVGKYAHSNRDHVLLHGWRPTLHWTFDGFRQLFLSNSNSLVHWDGADSYWTTNESITCVRWNGVASGDFDGNGRSGWWETFLRKVGCSYWQNRVKTIWPNSGWFEIDPGQDLTLANFHTGDFNGSGRTDIAYEYRDEGIGRHVLKVYFADTDGSFSDSPLIQDLLSLQHHPQTLVGDVNGDGISDIVTLRRSGSGTTTTVRVYLATGSGFQDPSSSIFAGWNDNFRAFFVDVTGDGRMELVRAIPAPNGNAIYQVYRFDGAKFNPIPIFEHTANHSYGSDTAQIIPAEFTGTGKGGFYHIWEQSGQTKVAAYVFFGEKPDLLTKAIRGNRSASLTDPPANEFAEITRIEYESIAADPDLYIKGSGAEFPVIDFQGPMHVVSAVFKDNGFGGWYRTDYTYEGARMDLQGRGFLGFRKFLSYDHETDIIRIEQVAQDFPLTGMVQGTFTYFETLDNLIGEVVNTLGFDGWEAQGTGGGRRYFPYIAESTERTWELDADGNAASSPHAVVTTISRFDDQADIITDLLPEANFPGGITWGNLRKIVVDYGDDLTTTTANEFYPATTSNGKWLLGRLEKATVIHSNGNAIEDIVRTSKFGYDPNSGLLEWEEIEPDHSPEPGERSLRLRTTYHRDGFGNIRETEIWSPDPAIGSYSIQTHIFEPTDKGRWPRKTRNALDHEEERRYDARFGTLTKLIGPNNLPTEWEYDNFGRTVLELRSDGTFTRTLREWDSSVEVTHPFELAQISAYRVTVTNGIGNPENPTATLPPVTTYYDRLGRAIRSETTGGNGSLVRTDTFFNELGLGTRVSEPYYVGGAIHYTTTTYDQLGRQKTLTIPDGTITEFRYEGLTTRTVKDSNLRQTTTVNAKGLTVEIRDPANVPLTFEYDPAGNLIKTIAPGNVETEMNYDIRGNKTWMKDPNMGTWEYRHNALGQLVWQKDAEQNVTEMAYDKLGRMTLRTINPPSGPSQVSEWRYDGDGPYAWKGALRQEIGHDGYRKSYYYDDLGRPFLDLYEIAEKWYYTYTRYDDWGRVRAVDRFWRPRNMEGPEFNKHYAWHSFSLRHRYNSYGYLDRIQDGAGHTWWETTNHYDAHGRPWRYQYGNNLEIRELYNPLTQAMVGKQTLPIVGGGIVESWIFHYDRLGNLTERTNSLKSLTETFRYDTRNRLTHRNNIQIATYSDVGNILSRQGIGGYTYGQNDAGPHAVTTLILPDQTQLTFGYDSNGNMTQRGSGSITWTPFNQPAAITKGNASIQFSYDANHNRIVQRIQQGSQHRKKIYVGGAMEQDRRLINPGTPEEQWETVQTRIFVSGPTGVIGAYTLHAENGSRREYFHKDHLGSIVAVSDFSGPALFGQIVEEYSFDAWGQRRDPVTWDLLEDTVENLLTDRGFTGHEMLDAVGLVHMNGRLYDPLLGRMISADPFVPQPGNLQSYNRYSYVKNNPLSYTDPSGYFHKKIGRTVKRFARTLWKPIKSVFISPVVGAWNYVRPHMGTIVAVGFSMAGMAPLGFAISGMISLSEGASLRDILIGTAIGAVAGMAAGPLAGKIANGMKIPAQHLARSVMQGSLTGALAGVTSALAYGRDVWKGAYQGSVVGGATGAVMHLYQSGFSESDWNDKNQHALKTSQEAYYKTGGALADYPEVHVPDGLSVYASHGPNGKLHVAFPGTRGFLAFSDWGANIRQAFGRPSIRYQQAIDLAIQIDLATNGNVIFVGHSLGGGLASAAAHATNGTAITFNAAGLSARYRTGNPTISAHFVRGDVLTMVQNFTPLPSNGARFTSAGRWYQGPLGRHGKYSFP